LYVLREFFGDRLTHVPNRNDGPWSCPPQLD
jgi:hypothetical protein